MRLLFDVALAVALAGTAFTSIFILYLLWRGSDEEEQSDKSYELYWEGYYSGFEDGHYEGRLTAQDDAEKAAAAI